MRGVAIRPGCPSHLTDSCAEWIQAGSTSANARGARGILECGADRHYLSWFSCWEESPGGLDARLISTKPLELAQGYYVTGEILVTRSTFCWENPSSIQNPRDPASYWPSKATNSQILRLEGDATCSRQARRAASVFAAGQPTPHRGRISLLAAPQASLACRSRHAPRGSGPQRIHRPTWSR